jgi:hypothetical protein
MEYDEDQARPNARDAELREQDYEGFLQEIEGDKEMRANINLYKADSATSPPQSAYTTTFVTSNALSGAALASASVPTTQTVKKSTTATSGSRTSKSTTSSKINSGKKAVSKSGSTARKASSGIAEDGGEGEGEWEDIDDDDEGFADDDEEAIRLDELLDEMTLQPSNNNRRTGTTTGNNNNNEELVNAMQLPGGAAATENDVVLLTPQDAASIAPVVLSTSGFDVADFNLSSVKFK